MKEIDREKDLLGFHKSLLIVFFCVIVLYSIAWSSWHVHFAAFETSVLRVGNAHSSSAGWCYIICIKSNGEIKVLDTFPVLYGIKTGMKNRAGDEKTPHGLYFIQRIDSRQNDFHKFGGYFLLLDYPNQDDIRHRRTGGNIGIHGGRVFPTYGCLRILDPNWSFGANNIRKFVSYLGKNYRIVIVRRLDHRLKGSKGQFLGKYAFERYTQIISNRELSRYRVLSLLE